MPLPEEFLSQFCHGAVYWRHEPTDEEQKRRMQLAAEACRESWHPSVCQWCLDFRGESEMVRDAVKLGHLKTALRIPDDTTPIICGTCWINALTAFQSNENPNRISNFLLRLSVGG